MYTLIAGARIWLLGLVVLWISIVNANVLDVPEDYGTIQAALAATVNGDTVLVAPGTYHEFVSCSTNVLTIAGWYPGDTLPEFRTLFDPIPSGPDTPSTVVLTGDTVFLKNIAFYNRLEMRQPIWSTRSGGIYHRGEFLQLQNCRFDSVSQSVDTDERVEALNCKFIGCKWQCLNALRTGPVHAENCVFDGSGSSLVFGGSGTTIINCTFRRSENGGTHLLQLDGQDILVRGCTFGHCGRGFSLIPINPMGNCRITDCVFEDVTGTPNLIEVYMDCPSIVDTPIVISNNVFRRFEGEENYGGTTAIGLGCQTPDAGYFGIISNNLFFEGTNQQNASGIGTNGSIHLLNNTFEEMRPEATPDVNSVSHVGDTIFARNNSFLEPGIAAQSNSDCYFDAQWNWWGDSTGPFHAILNPEGMGTEVGNGVIFEPWLRADPDTSIDTTHVVVNDEAVLLPNSDSLRAYPNPFNSTTNLLIEVGTPGAYEVILYDVTGRAVARLFSGRIERQKLLNISAEGFASGVYFARLSSVNKSFAAVKLLLLK